MPTIETHKLNSRSGLEAQRQIYNGLDCCLTVEVLEELQNLPRHESQTYDFSRALQAPILDMMLRGIRIDEYERRKGIELLTQRIDRLEFMLMKLAVSMWGKPLNPRSPQQLKDFFYDAMKIPEQHIREKGKKKVSTNRETLEKLQAYFHVRPIISVILCLRDYHKQRNVLQTQVDSDQRMRTSYNIGGTETGRLSSSKSATGSGNNMQNLQKDTDEVASGDRVSIRRVFTADDDWKMCGIDLEQTESHDVGLIHGLVLGDWTYLDAVESGDIHTRVATMVWPDLGWPGDKRGNREIADRTFYRNFSYRDMAKRGGHASNYMTTPFTMSRALKIPIAVAKSFQQRYYTAFPAFPRWFRWTAQEIQTKQVLTTPFGRTRQFFGRPRDDATLREAIAFIPQSTSADRMNLGLYRLWSKAGLQDRIRLLAQVHDAVYFLYRPEDENWIISWALKEIEIVMDYGFRKMIVPGEAKIGWNLGNYDPKGNPDGLKKFSLDKPDTRTRTDIFNRVF